MKLRKSTKAYCRLCGCQNPAAEVVCPECRQAMDEEASEPGAAERFSRPTAHPVGSDCRYLVYVQRAALGLPLFHPGDARHIVTKAGNDVSQTGEGEVRIGRRRGRPAALPDDVADCPMGLRGAA